MFFGCQLLPNLLPRRIDHPAKIIQIGFKTVNKIFGNSPGPCLKGKSFEKAGHGPFYSRFNRPMQPLRYHPAGPIQPQSQIQKKQQQASKTLPRSRGGSFNHRCVVSDGYQSDGDMVFSCLRIKSPLRDARKKCVQK